jgi:FKBP-type peptidyl-prolyl cis-trans isomerase SlyD
LLFCIVVAQISRIFRKNKSLSMIIAKDCVVAVNYHLTVPGENGEGETTVEQTSVQEPFVFLFGVGQLLPEFEANLIGKTVGAAFDFRIEAANGYGVYQLEHIVNIPMDAFLDEEGKLDSEMIATGKSVPMMDNEGNRLWGKVLGVEADHVRMDFNHPLAGKQLHFVGEVLEVRTAEADELAHGHAHGAGGHQH